MVYPCHILLLSLPSHNFPVKPLHPTKELFCALQILIKALDAFILMKTRFYLENILLGYTKHISGISKEKVYTWYIPGIYHEKTFWGFQMHDFTGPDINMDFPEAQVGCEAVESVRWLWTAA